jgi:hypothetical protein
MTAAGREQEGASSLEPTFTAERKPANGHQQGVVVEGDNLLAMLANLVHESRVVLVQPLGHEANRSDILEPTSSFRERDSPWTQTVTRAKMDATRPLVATEARAITNSAKARMTIAEIFSAVATIYLPRTVMCCTGSIGINHYHYQHQSINQA